MDSEYINPMSDAELNEEVAYDQVVAVDQSDMPAVNGHVAADRAHWHRDTIFAYYPSGADDEKAYDLTKFPFSITEHLAYVGFKSIMTSAKDRAATYAALVAGNVSTRKPAGEKVAKVSDWRLAIAGAMVEATKKAETPLTIDAAKAKAIELTSEQVRALKTDAVVIKHYNKAKGIVGGLSALLAA